MRNAFLIFLFGLIFSAVYASNQVVENFDRTFDVSGRAKLDISNVEGKTVVNAKDGSQVIVHVVKEVQGASSAEQAKEEADRVRVEIEQSGSGIRIAAEYPRNDFRHYPRPEVFVHFEISAPPESDVSVRSVDGNAEAKGFRGNVELHTIDGDIVISNCSGRLFVHSSDGAITADQCSGELDFSVADGNMTLRHLDGTLTTRASDGRIDASGIFDRVTAKVSDGKIGIAAQKGSRLRENWNIQAVDGEIRLQLPADVQGNVDITTSDGHIQMDQMMKINGKISSNHLQGP